MSKYSFLAILLVTVAQIPQAYGATPWFAPLTATWMQNDAAKPADEAKPDAKSLQELSERINKLEAEVERLKNGAAQPKAAANGGEVMMLVDMAHVGLLYQATGQTRYIALHLIVANPTGKPVTLAQDQI